MKEKRAGARRVRKIARETFGYERLRPGQEAAIQSAIAGHDTLAVMPTGSGKSAIYQLVGNQLPGPTVVVSPLIALQHDQVTSIRAQDIGGAALINSTLRSSERRSTLRQLQENSLEFLFLAPEQFSNEQLMGQIQAAQPSLFVVDEAHCVSEWGHDFRPDYFRLRSVIERLGHPTVLALTATAAPPVRQEIVERLGMRNPQVIVSGFDRPNIWMGVETFTSEAAKRRALFERVDQTEKPGIIYAATRKRAEELSHDLQQRGVRATVYHGGLRPRERERAQTAFMDDQVEVIVATTAFGMGIDKPNVRFVFHYDISESLDSYYQEIGRAGRDGEDADAILFYRPEDIGIRRFFGGGSQVDIDQVTNLAQLVHAQHGPIDAQNLRELSGLSQSQLASALSRLEEAGALRMHANGQVEADRQAPDLGKAAEVAARAQSRRRDYERSRVEMVRNYAEVRDCRREFMLNYFGEAFDGPCGFCDNCDAGRNVARDTHAEPFPLNSRVAHTAWGAGSIMRYEGSKVVVLFDTVGYKTLALDLVTERQLLRAAS